MHWMSYRTAGPNKCFMYRAEVSLFHVTCRYYPGGETKRISHFLCNHLHRAHSHTLLNTIVLVNIRDVSKIAVGFGNNNKTVLGLSFLCICDESR